MAIGDNHVTIIGAGIFGLACAWATVRRGRRVRVLEATRVGAGASGGIVGALSPHVPDQWNAKKQFQFEALSQAEPYWQEIREVSGVDPGFGRLGRLIPIPNEAGRDLARARHMAARQNWDGNADWDLVDAPAFLSAEAAPFGAIHETLSARLFPRDAVRALAQACAAKGVQIEEGCPVSSVTGLPGQVVVAAGVAGFSLAGTRGSGVKGQAALLRPVQALPGPMIYADGLYIVPQANGLIAVGSTSENDFTDPTGTDAQLDALLARARTVCPALAEADLVERWAGLRPRAPKRDPMLGPLPGSEGVILALGGFKIGFGIAPKVGEVIADMLDGEPVEIPDTFTASHHLEG